jgi:hypothetical protein
MTSSPAARDRKPRSIVAGILAVIAIGAGITAGVAYSRENTRLATWTHVPGTVISTPYGGSHPEIAFTAPDGRKISFSQGGWIFGYHDGDQVDVLYDQDSMAHRAMIDTAGATHTLSIELAFVSLFLGVMAIAAMLGALYMRGGSEPPRNAANYLD